MTNAPWIALALLVSVGHVAAAADVPPTVLEAEQTRIAAINKATQSAVAIFTPDGNGGGSGVVISSDGYAVSNFHVTSSAGDYMQCGMADGTLYDAVIVSIDPTGDVALLKLLGRDDFRAAELADSDRVLAGDWCFAVGNPFLLATDFQPTVTYGIVSGVHRYQYPAGTILEYADCIQTDAAINPGNSGGPLFNADGQLIGIVGRGSFEKRGRVNVGVGYAISINQVKNFIGHLKSGRIVDHATLGATVNRDERGRVVVSNILETSDAFRRGLRYGDEVLAFGGRPIPSVNAFKNILGIFPEGWRVPMSFRRDDERFDVHVRLAGVHTRAEMQKLLAEPPSEDAPLPPQPDPDEEKTPNKDQDSPKGKGKLPQRPRAAGPPKPAIKVPESVAKLIQPRSGYKNYYFNELHRDRVWAKFAGAQFNSLTSPWELRGQMAAGGDFVLRLGDTESTLEISGVKSTVSANVDLHAQLEPGGTGLLATLHLWRRALVLGPQKFGEVRYLGTSPVPGLDGLFDTLTATHDVTESLLYFAPSNGHLVSMEMFSDLGAEACELLFEDYRAIDDRQAPHRIVVRRGGEVIAELRIAQVAWKAAVK